MNQKNPKQKLKNIALPKRILISTNEISADENAANLVRYIKKNYNNTFLFAAIGGDALKKENVDIIFDISTTNTVGIIEGIPSLIHDFFFLNRLKQYLKKNHFDIVLCVDGQGKNIPIGKIAKKKKIKTAYYFPPPIFIWGTWYKKQIKKYFDFVFCPFKDNVSLYKEEGINSHLVGHPFSIIKQSNNHQQKNILLKKLEIPSQSKVIAIFPGSRYQEINTLTPIFLKAAKSFKKAYPNTFFIIACSHTKFEKKIKQYQKEIFNTFLLKESAKKTLGISDFAWMSSGTATLLASFLSVPHAICYKISFLSYIILKKLNRHPFIGILNILSKKMICQEFTNKALNENNLIEYTKSILFNKKKYQHLTQNLNKACLPLKKKDPFEPIVKGLLKLSKN